MFPTQAEAAQERQLSVIVPLAPDEAEGQGLLLQLRALPPGCEVIVVHADETPWRAPADWPRTLRYQTTRSEPGRARQQNVGARLASGYWLWFLHADTRLRPECLPALQKFIDSGADAMGWFKLAFRHDGPRLTALNAAGANWRSRWLGLPFGDQGLVLPRHWFATLHGFAEDVTAGEDHLLVWAARHAGLPLRSIPAALETSARKYARDGWLTTTWRHWRLTRAQVRLGRNRGRG